MLRKLKRWELPAWGGGKGRKEGRKGEAPPIHCYHPLALPAPWGLKRWLAHGHRHRSCRSTATGSMRPAGRNSNCTERSGLPSSFQPKWPTAVTTDREQTQGAPPRLCSQGPRRACFVGRRYSKGTVSNSDGYATLEGASNVAAYASSVQLLSAQVPVVSNDADIWAVTPEVNSVRIRLHTVRGRCSKRSGRFN